MNTSICFVLVALAMFDLVSAVSLAENHNLDESSLSYDFDPTFNQELVPMTENDKFLDAG